MATGRNGGPGKAAVTPISIEDLGKLLKANLKAKQRASPTAIKSVTLTVKLLGQIGVASSADLILTEELRRRYLLAWWEQTSAREARNRTLIYRLYSLAMLADFAVVKGGLASTVCDARPLPLPRDCDEESPMYRRGDESREPPNERGPTPTLAEMRALASHLMAEAPGDWEAARTLALVATVAMGGVSQAEARDLEFSALRLDATPPTLTVESRRLVKYRTNRSVVPIPAVLAELLRSWERRCGGKYVFPATRREAPWDRVATKPLVRAAAKLRAACRKAGVPDFTLRGVEEFGRNYRDRLEDRATNPFRDAASALAPSPLPIEAFERAVLAQPRYASASGKTLEPLRRCLGVLRSEPTFRSTLDLTAENLAAFVAAYVAAYKRGKIERPAFPTSWYRKLCRLAYKIGYVGVNSYPTAERKRKPAAPDLPLRGRRFAGISPRAPGPGRGIVGLDASPRDATPRPCPIEMTGPRKPPRVNGVLMDVPLSAALEDCLGAMVRLYKEGRPRNKLDVIATLSGRDDPRACIVRLRKIPLLKPYIIAAQRKGGGGYGIGWGRDDD